MSLSVQGRKSTEPGWAALCLIAREDEKGKKRRCGTIKTSPDHASADCNLQPNIRRPLKFKVPTQRRNIKRNNGAWKEAGEAELTIVRVSTCNWNWECDFTVPAAITLKTCAHAQAGISDLNASDCIAHSKDYMLHCQSLNKMQKKQHNGTYCWPIKSSLTRLLFVTGDGK